MTRPVKQRGELGERTKIAQGGQGVVYHAPKIRTTFAASLVYKEYKAQARARVDFSALAEMPSLVENSLSRPDGERLISIAAWPCEMVEDAGEPTGFVMPAIPDQFYIYLTTMRGSSRNPAEFQHLLNDESMLLARGISIDEVQRLTLLREVASGLAFLHSHGVCVGDISPKNLLFSLTPSDAIYFIDCDAMRINGVSALSQAETPGWEVPHGEELATIYSDTYKLGLLALRLLAGEQDVRDANALPPSTPDMVRRIITDTLRIEPQKRPLPEVWTYQLGYAIEEAQHRQESAPADPPPKPASTASALTARAQAISAPRTAPTFAPSPSGIAEDVSSDKTFVIVTVVAIVVVVLIVIIVAGISANSNSGTVSSTSSSTDTYAPFSSRDGTAASETDTPSVATAPSAMTPPSTPPQQSIDQVLPDADIHGFTYYPGAHCLDIDTAAAIGRTSDALVVICQPRSGGQLYYKGFGLKNNSGVFINDVVSNGTGFLAYNKGYQYMVSSDALVITQGASLVISEQWVEYWPR